ncbi:MAG: transcriptional regulator [Saprospiraceae bacterium]|nr:MAG: transcriptional regulator [Saprospiraceae bacterium]
MKITDTYKLQGWTVHPELNLLKNQQTELVLKPRLMRLLDYFLQNPDAIVTKDDLLEYVWEGRLVTENLLTKSISELRQLLKIHFREEIQIETLRNVGYRLQINPVITPEVSRETPVSLNDEIVKQQPLHTFHNRWIYGLLTGIGLVGLLAFVTWSGPREQSWIMKHHKITSLPGLEMHPAVSPDGKNIAFSWRNDVNDTPQIYVRPLHSTTPRKLSSSESLEFSPVWSLDGQHLVYIRQLNSGQLKLIKSSIIGVEEMELATLDFVMADQLLWAKDGQSLIFQAQPTLKDSRALYAFDQTTATIKQLTQPPTGIYGDIYPSYSATMDKIAFIRADFGESIFSHAAPTEGTIMELQLTTGDLHPLTKVHREINGFLYYPAMDSYLCWVTEQLGQYTIISINGEGKQNIIGQTSVGVPRNATLLPGNKICYEYWRSNMDISTYPIVVNVPEKIGPPQAFLHSTSWDWGLSFAAKASRAAFFSQRNGYSEIWLTETNAPQNARQLTQLESPLLKSLALSPDGRQIVFNSVKDNQADLYLIQSNGQGLQQLTNSQADYAAPEWSADGQSLYYSSNTSGDWQLYEHNLITNKVTQLTTEGGFRALPVPQNKELLYFVKYTEDGLWQYNLTTKITQFVAPLQELHHSINWALTDQGVYYLSWQKGACYLEYYDVATQQNQAIQLLENMIAGIPSLALSSDFQSIFVAKGSGLNADILEIEFLKE